MITGRQRTALTYFQVHVATLTASGAAAVHAARDELTAAAADRGWAVTLVRDHDTFCPLLVHGAEDLIIDIALDSTPILPPQRSTVGPTFDARERAGRKLVALSDRAAARDFVDVYLLPRPLSASTPSRQLCTP